MPATSTDAAPTDAAPPRLARRALLGALSAAGLAAAARAQQRDSVVIGWPAELPGWDPNRHEDALAQSIYRMVYDPVIGQDPRRGLLPHLARAWTEDADGASLALDLRDDVRFHDGSRLTAADLRWTFGEHAAAAGSPWQEPPLAIETPAPDRVVLRFAAPMPDAARGLAFLRCFVLPHAYMQRVGADAFQAAPVGSGPFRVAEYRPGARIVLERNPHYWGPAPLLRRVTVEIVRPAALRLAAVRAGRLDLTVMVPVRDLAGFGEADPLAAEVNPVTRLVLLELRPQGGFRAADVRLAAHHAIDKAALSRAFFADAAQPLAVPALPGSGGFVDSQVLPFDTHAALNLLDDFGFGPDNPVPVRLAATRGAFLGDWEIARAIVAMWRAVGIAAELEAIADGAGSAAPGADAVLRSVEADGAAAGLDADRLGGWRHPASPWATSGLGRQAAALAAQADPDQRALDWRALNRAAVAQGACIPLLQGVQTLVRRRNLGYQGYGSGWVLGQSMHWV